MKEQQDYARDIAAVRSMMERTTKFLSLSGVSGVMAGVYALIGAYVAYRVYGFNPRHPLYTGSALDQYTAVMPQITAVAVAVLLLAIGTAIVLSFRKASKKGERLWNPTARRLLINLSIPLVAGGLFIILILAHGLIGLIAPCTLLFYGMALYNASKFTLDEMRSLGLIEIVLGLIATYSVEYGLLIWALGFGVVHIIYGIYVHYRYER